MGAQLSGGVTGGPHLLHQHVDVQLGIVQHMAVGPAQAHQRLLHGPAVYVDPAGSARRQELPVQVRGGAEPWWVWAPRGAAAATATTGPWHSLVHGVQQGGDLGLPSMAQLLTGLPEAEVLGWGSGQGVRPTPGGGNPGMRRQQTPPPRPSRRLEQGWGLLTAELCPEKAHEVGPSHGVFQELPEAEGPLLHTELRGHSHTGEGGGSGAPRATQPGPLPARAPGLTWVRSGPSRHHRP